MCAGGGDPPSRLAPPAHLLQRDVDVHVSPYLLCGVGRRLAQQASRPVLVSQRLVRHAHAGVMQVPRLTHKDKVEKDEALAPRDKRKRPYGHVIRLGGQQGACIAGEGMSCPWCLTVQLHVVETAGTGPEHTA